MKSILIGLVLLSVAPSAFAARRNVDCSPVFVADNSETAAGHWVSPCGQNYTITHRACNEGEYAYSTEMGASGEYVTVTLVCKNGSFVAPSAPVTHGTCRNGDYSYGSEYGGSGELVNVTYICRNGAWYRN